ncbi:hypothetical protein OXPF_21790 [Oxobacter pfennigii]|uniref:Uncharacterized protein n=1 Tax=Oxobacter pfennigii TaxID=36849 RepID=A0A0P8W8G3_9CLOT|nr:hypothetical protein [Oxobacter pfennigii]KPU44013.1 hypothetical protein OXPF_21790 [Oxobacter pfennigii]
MKSFFYKLLLFLRKMLVESKGISISENEIKTGKPILDKIISEYVEESRPY